METLKQRLYFFVPYNISPIQQAIQAGHAALEYAWLYPGSKEFIDFIKNDKTWIILNGGTTRSIEEDPGTMQILLTELIDFKKQITSSKNWINYSLFFEPDLNNALTAICFLADERVWDYETYPEFSDWLFDVKMYTFARDAMPTQNQYSIRKMKTADLEQIFPEYFEEWVNTVLGNRKNLFLRDLIRGKKLA